MSTAPELFASGMRDHFAPALRALGFTGWRHSFTIPDETHWAVLGIELGTVEERLVRYTLNLGLTPKRAWAGRPLRPNPNTVTGLETWRARIGELLPVGGEVWWEVTPGPRWLVAVEDSVAAVQRYALPELLRRLAETPTVTYLAPVELEEVNAALAVVAVARIQRAELAEGALLLHGAWSRRDAVTAEVLQGVARGFLSVGDDRYGLVHCHDTLGRLLWTFEALEPESH